MKKFIGILLFAIMIISAFLVMENVRTGNAMNHPILLGDVIVGGMWTDQMTHFRRGLSKKMHNLVWNYGRWSKLIGWIDVNKMKAAGVYAGSIQLNPTGNVIDVVKDYMREGGIYMDIPVKYPLTGQGRHGSATLRGHEEKRIILNKKNAINQVRHAVTIQDSKMSKLVLQKEPMQYVLMERAFEDLRDWFGRKTNFYPYQALFAGYSDNLTDSVNGVNKTQKSHPNFYVKGYGKVPFTAFGAAYETAVSDGLATLVDEDTDKFSVASLRDMAYLASYHMIQPVKIAGGEYFLVFISPAQMRQLRRDPEWLQIHREAGVRGPGNQIFSGITEGYPFETCYIIVDNTIPGARITGDTGYDATRGTVNYGSALYMANPRDVVSVKKIAVLVGAGAMTCGYGDELGFVSEKADYEAFLGDSASATLGMERADIFDDDNMLGGGAGALVGNYSSLAYATYSPDVPDNI